MNEHVEQPRWAWLSAAGFAALTYVALFRLPFHFPPRNRLVSASYMFGFNNAVAILAMAGLLGAFALFCLFRRSRAFDPLVEFPGPREGVAPPLPAWLFAVVAAVYAGLTALAAWYAQQSVTASLTWEARHFLHRIKLYEVYHLRPYLDFQVEYGPALMYPPVYLHRLLAPLGVSTEGAYFLCHLLMNLLGLFCLFSVISHATGPRERRAVAFVLAGLAGFAPYLGLNGSVLRYVASFATLLIGHRLLIRLEGAAPRFRWPASVAVVSTLLAANVLISPEIGVAFALGWLAYAVLAARQGRGILSATLAATLLVGALCRLFLPEAYYASLLRFSEGANNLPMLPAAHLVLYVITLLLLVPPLLAAGWRGGSSDAPLLGAFAALSVAMMPGALGRCDPPHVLFYGLVPSLLLMARLAHASRRLFAGYAFAYAAVFIGLMQLVNLGVFFDVAYRNLLKPSEIRDLAARLRSELAPRDLKYLSELDKYPEIGLPFATYGYDNAAEAYLFDRHKVAPEYYVGAVGVYTEAQIARKLQDVSRHEYVLVKEGWETPWVKNQCEVYLKGLRRWFLYPVSLDCKRADLDSHGELNEFIAANYHPVQRVGPSVLLQRNPAAATTRPATGHGASVGGPNTAVP